MAVILCSDVELKRAMNRNLLLRGRRAMLDVSDEDLYDQLNDAPLEEIYPEELTSLLLRGKKAATSRNLLLRYPLALSHSSHPPPLLTSHLCRGRKSEFNRNLLLRG